MKKAIALIYGGEGAEHDISLLGAENISENIDREKFEVISVFISKSGEWLIDNAPAFPVYLNGRSGFYTADKIIPIDVALPILHGNLGEDGVVSGLLKSAHIRFIGCDVSAGAVCADKIITRSVADSLSIPGAKWLFSDESDPFSVLNDVKQSLSFPLFIKPATLGSSIGISRAEGEEDFIEAYERAYALSKRVLIEEAVDVYSELECAYLSLGGEEEFAVGEVLSGGRFYDFEKKYSTATKTDICPSDKKAEARAIEYARRLVKAIGIRQIARLDFFLTRSGEVLFNEINTLPGMTKTSLYPALTVKMGLPGGEFINRLIEDALL